VEARRKRRGDEALVAALAEDPEAFVELYRRYEAPLLAYFRRRTRAPELAADLTGEVFARTLEALRAGQAPSGPFSAWL
jgi:DNA-directed RNA polymerase specialized sigma24 family protein